MARKISFFSLTSNTDAYIASPFDEVHNYMNEFAQYLDVNKNFPPADQNIKDMIKNLELRRLQHNQPLNTKDKGKDWINLVREILGFNKGFYRARYRQDADREQVKQQVEEALIILWHKSRFIDDNLSYLAKTLSRIEEAWARYNAFPQRRTYSSFGSPIASVLMQSAIKSIEYNIINFSEHLQGLSENPLLKELYQKNMLKVFLMFFKTLLRKAEIIFLILETTLFICHTNLIMV